MEVDHDLVMVDEFDALAIEVKLPKGHNKKNSSSSSPSSPKSIAKALATKAWAQSIPPNSAWLNEKIKFPAKTHATKVASYLEPTANGIIYLPGAEDKYYEDSDQGPAFRQRRHFYYLSGANFPGCAVTYDLHQDRLILWIPYTDPRTILWYGRTPTVEEVKASTDVDEVRYVAGVNRYICASLTPGASIYVLHPDQAPQLESPKGVVQIDTHSLRPAIENARVIKSDYEIAMIRRANALSSAAHKAVLGRLSRLTNERELEAIFAGYCIAQGAHTQAYPIIAGAGPAASTLHYDTNNAPLSPHQFVVLDAGCEWNCYASDITRTYPIPGSFSPEAESIYNIVLRMQRECIEKIKPGVVYSSLHLHACKVAIDELLRLGIFYQGTAEEILARGTIAAFFPHGLGHHVGLEVHDVSGRERLLLDSKSSLAPAGGVKSNRCKLSPSKREVVLPETVGVMYRDEMKAKSSGGGKGEAVQMQKAKRTAGGGRQKLQEGMVVTVEPGIYFCKEYLRAYFLDVGHHAHFINTKVLEKYWDLGGVRIEDDILVTKNGWENLTDVPRGVEEVLKMMNHGP
ncbi:peptidase M24, structural domain-containing protein [Triangularia verruculosa]|uniref:Xaa-Pro aminopeptidase n=1 Tax=Triangularia verruculosa TaxID=2587418 RepID=A0AAN7AS57_9PEZI|nr:peptidase M24, structural domain-containing protein [Triangularia verruculosa]